MIQYEFGMHSHVFPDELNNPFLRTSGIGIERRGEKEYYFDNKERHMNSYLFQYTLKGKGIYESNGQTHILTPGRAFFIHIPEDSYYYMPEDNQENPWEFIYLLMEGEHARKYYDLICEKSGKVLSLSPENEAIQTLFDLFRQSKNGRLRHPFYASELIYRFLCQLCQSIFHNEEDYSRRTKEAIYIMEKNYASLEGIDEIASLLQISPSHLSREFARETGISPIKFLTNVRLSEAAKMLQETNLTVNEIALACGFAGGNYFSKIFRRHMNMAPLEFRLERK